MPLQVSESIELFGPVLLKRSSDQNAAKETFLSFTGGRDKEKDSLFLLMCFLFTIRLSEAVNSMNIGPLSVLLQCPQCLAQCLAHSGCSGAKLVH